MNLSSFFGSIGGNVGFGGLSLNTALRFIAEPASRFATFLGNASGSTSNKLTSANASSGIEGQIASLEDLMMQQQAMQLQMQAISAATNIMKTEHDMRMAVIRNLKVD